MGYLRWSLLALAGYTLVAPLVRVASREVPSAVVALVTNAMLVAAAAVLVVREDAGVIEHLTGPSAPYIYAAGGCLAVGILAYYRALSLGPVSVVVPVFGLFVVTSSLAGAVFLDEPVTARKALGVAFAAVAVWLTAGAR
jgi:transporter family protein